MSSTTLILSSGHGKSSVTDVTKQDLWDQALNTLSVEDKKQYVKSPSDMLDVLKKACNKTPVMRMHMNTAMRGSLLICILSIGPRSDREKDRRMCCKGLEHLFQ